MTSTANAGTRGPYAKTAQVRKRILDASMEVFSETGFHATTMKEIAERAGISERGLVHHFPAKSDLLTAVLERREAENTERVPMSAGLDALLGMLEVVADDSRQPRVVELHALLSAEAPNAEHPAHAHYAFRYEMFRLFAVQCFAALREAGELDTPLSDADLGAAYVALSDGLQLQWLYHPDALEPAAVIRRFLESLIPRLAQTSGR
jgi:AcrR family transcriptional regulator